MESIASRRNLLGLNTTAFLAPLSIVSPVEGFLPFLAFLCCTRKLPNLGSLIPLPSVKFSFKSSKKYSTISADSLLERPICRGICADNSLFVRIPTPLYDLNSAPKELFNSFIANFCTSFASSSVSVFSSDLNHIEITTLFFSLPSDSD